MAKLLYKQLEEVGKLKQQFKDFVTQTLEITRDRPGESSFPLDGLLCLLAKCIKIGYKLIAQYSLLCMDPKVKDRYIHDSLAHKAQVLELESKYKRTLLAMRSQEGQ